MSAKKSNHKAPSFSVMYLAILLLAAVLITTHMTGGIAARFLSVSSASDSARVAKFDVSCQKTVQADLDIELNFLDPAKSQDAFQFTTVSASEVAMTYDVVIQLPETLATWVSNEWITVVLDEDKKATVTDGDTLTFQGGTFNAEGGEKTHTLTFTASSSEMPASQETPVDLKAVLRIHAVQVD
jgi:cytoskeletal protein RodZ